MSLRERELPPAVCLEGESERDPEAVIEFILAKDGLAVCAVSECPVAIMWMGDGFYQKDVCPIRAILGQVDE